jgi:hypothetical protein
MKQTAVEWLLEQVPRIETIASFDILEQAKAMEKEQIVDAYYYAVKVDSFTIENPWDEAEQYYTETYESNTRI